MLRFFLRRIVPITATVLALGWQTACSSDDGDDDGGGGSSGSGTGGSGGGNRCVEQCTDGLVCSECFNAENPDVPLYVCIAPDTTC